MFSYIDKPKTINKSYFNNSNYFSLSPFSHREILYSNENIKTIRNLLIKKFKGFEPGLNNYLKYSGDFLLRITEMNNLYFTSKITELTQRIIPLNYNKDKVSKFDLIYQTASGNVGNVCIYNDELDVYYNSHIRKLIFDENYKLYIFAFLKSMFCRQQVEVAGSIKGVDNFSDDYLLKTIIPFPNIQNNENPEKIMDLVTLITKNIINKEDLINKKFKIIDCIIVNELDSNQNNNNFSFSFPKLSDLKLTGRLDTGLYQEEYKFLINKIINYKYGFFRIPNNLFKGGSTPEIRIFSYNANHTWVTPTNITDEGNYIPAERISMQKNTNINNDCVLIINRTSKGKKGEYVGIACFYDYNYFGKGQHNQGIYCINDFTKDTKIFIAAFLNSKIMRKICGFVSMGTKMKEMKIEEFANLPLPSFRDNIKNEIIKNYYFDIPKNTNQTFESYLPSEFERNNILGLYQLNNEVIELKNYLFNLI